MPFDWNSPLQLHMSCLYRYTMLLGRPPFETTNLKETYRCIREARYTMPSTLSPQAKHLISIMLAKSPEDRPRLDDILNHDFFNQVCVIGSWRQNTLLGFGHSMMFCSLCLRPVLVLPPSRVLPQTDCLSAAVTQLQTSNIQALPKASSRRLQLHCLVARRTKPSTLKH